MISIFSPCVIRTTINDVYTAATTDNIIPCCHDLSETSLIVDLCVEYSLLIFFRLFRKDHLSNYTAIIRLEGLGIRKVCDGNRLTG